MDTDRRDDRDPVHGAAQAARAHGALIGVVDRDPDAVPRHPSRPARIAPKTYGPAGGYDIFTHLVAGVFYVFGFIVAATLGCTAGSVDLTEGMFRHLVVTGRSRLALYLARIPAGLAIIVPIVATGFTIVCAVCVFAAPTTLNYQGVNVPAGLSRTGLETWAAEHANAVFCDFERADPRGRHVRQRVPSASRSVKGPNGLDHQRHPRSSRRFPASNAEQLKAQAVQIADQNYADYAK